MGMADLRGRVNELITVSPSDDVPCPWVLGRWQGQSSGWAGGVRVHLGASGWEEVSLPVYGLPELLCTAVHPVNNETVSST